MSETFATPLAGVDKLPPMVVSSEFRIGLVIPRSGSAGIYGPSCKYCAELAVAEINEKGGFGGRRLSLVQIDGGQHPRAVSDVVQSLLAAGSLDAIVGVHDSNVRQAVKRLTLGQIPYIYAGNYEGESRAKDVLSIGLTIAQQIAGSLPWLAENRGLRDWFFIGNDSGWPRTVERDLRTFAEQSGLRLVGTEYVPMGSENFSHCLRALHETSPDAVFALLVGTDAVTFSRQFSRRNLDRNIARFMPLFEENSMFAVSPSIGEGIYTAGIFFADIKASGELDFMQRYELRFGENAPQLNGFAVACYESITLLSELFGVTGGRTPSDGIAAYEGLEFPVVHGRSRIEQGHAVRDVLLAEGKDSILRIVATFPQVSPAG